MLLQETLRALLPANYCQLFPSLVPPKGGREEEPLLEASVWLQRLNKLYLCSRQGGQVGESLTQRGLPEPVLTGSSVC